MHELFILHVYLLELPSSFLFIFILLAHICSNLSFDRQIESCVPVPAFATATATVAPMFIICATARPRIRMQCSLVSSGLTKQRWVCAKHWTNTLCLWKRIFLYFVSFSLFLPPKHYGSLAIHIFILQSSPSSSTRCAQLVPMPYPRPMLILFTIMTLCALHAAATGRERERAREAAQCENQNAANLVHFCSVRSVAHV